MHCLQLDVTNQESIQTAVASAIESCGRIEILVNHADGDAHKPADEVSWEDWNQVVVAQAVANQMIEQRYGRIINIGSMALLEAYKEFVPQGASRGGMTQMTIRLANDWGPHGISVNCLAPGWFQTDQNNDLNDDPSWIEMLEQRIPLGRPGIANDLQGALLLLASQAARYITGQTLHVDGGLSVGDMRATPVEQKEEEDDDADADEATDEIES